MTQHLIAEAAIRQLHARFVDAVWRKDADSFAGLFAEDGEWKIATLHFRGRAEVQGAFAKLLGACERVVAIPSPPILEIGQGTATGRVYVTEFAKMGDGTSAFTIGIYYDRYVEEAGEWKFQWRHFALQYRGPADLPAPFVECPDYGPPPNLPAPDEPTFTRRKG